jgi:hypothetical protein
MSTGGTDWLALAKALECNLVPDTDVVADWVQLVASDLASTEFKGEVWSTFYDEVADAIGDNAQAVVGKRIILDDRGKLLPAGLADGGVTIFFARPEVEEGRLAEPPGELREYLAFTHPEIPWNWQIGPRRQQRPGRIWLERHSLVKEYRSDAVLELVSTAMRSADADDHMRSALLEFAFRLWGSTREISSQSLRAAQLLVPTRSGWIAAPQATFGAGWGGDYEDLDKLVERLVEAASAVSPAIARLGTSLATVPTSLGEIAKDGRFREFL